MSTTDMPADFTDRAAGEGIEAQPPAKGPWTEAVLTVVFAAAAVLFVSFIAVVTGLV